CADGRVRLDDELRRVGGQLPPGDLLVRYGARVRAIARRRVADLAEVAPQRHVVSLEILVNHRDDADGEIASDAAADLEESDRGCRRRVAVPRREAHHRLDAALDRLRILDLAFHAPCGEDVAERRVFPAGYEDRQV